MICSRRVKVPGSSSIGSDRVSSARQVAGYRRSCPGVWHTLSGHEPHVGRAQSVNDDTGCRDLARQHGKNVFAGLLAATIFTVIVQSSSAVTGLVVAMGMSQAISLDGAVAILLGANIGTCATGLIASARLSRAARQASIAQIIINVAGVLIFLPFLSPFVQFVSRTSPDLPRQIANAYTIFNVAVSVILFPCVGYIAWAAKRLAPEKQESEAKVTVLLIRSNTNFPPSRSQRQAENCFEWGSGRSKCSNAAG